MRSSQQYVNTTSAVLRPGGNEVVGPHVAGRCGIKDTPSLYIEPGSPCENGYIESFSGKLWDELLDRETFHTFIGRTQQQWNIAVLMGCRSEAG